jgi:hypothetical protein
VLEPEPDSPKEVIEPEKKVIVVEADVLKRIESKVEVK